MMRRVTHGLLPLLCLMGVSSNASADVVVSVVGDIDGFSPGDPADTPNRSQELLDALAVANALPPIDLDQPLTNDTLGFTHVFELPAGQQVVAATLTVGVFPGGGFVASDFFGLDVNIGAGITWGSAFGPRAVWTDVIGGVPPSNQTTDIVIDLAAVLMRPSESGSPTIWNLLPELADGELNVIAADDSGIDYSILEIVTIPEPSTALLLGMAGVLVRRQRRERKRGKKKGHH